MSETKPKKMVSRSVAIALGIICIILVAALGAVANTLNSYVASHHYTDSAYDAVQNQVSDLTSTLNLYKSTVWVNPQTISQPQDSWYNWTFRADYAGYVSVQVYNSTILNPLAEVVYSYHGIHYDQQTEVGTIGRVTFPIMPSSIEIRVGNGPHVRYL